MLQLRKRCIFHASSARIAFPAASEFAFLDPRVAVCLFPQELVLTRGFRLDDVVAGGTPVSPLLVRHSSTAPQPSTAAGSVQQAASNTVSWLRSWIMPAGSDFPVSLAPSREPPTKAPPTSENKKKEVDAMEQMRAARDMDVDGFVEQCRQNRIAQPAPRPRFPALPANSHGFKRYLDMRRVAFLRMAQIEAIAQRMTAEDKALVKAASDNAIAAARGREALQPDILADKKLLSRTAERTNGRYMELEVKDCIAVYMQSRRRAARLYHWAKDLGNGVPQGSELEDIEKAMIADENQEKASRLVQLRETNPCPLEGKRAWAGPRTHCSLTGLSLARCCGAADLAHTKRRRRTYGGPVVLERKRLSEGVWHPYRELRRQQMEPRFVE